MRQRYILVTLLTLLLSAQKSLALYKVHEWGTFTSLVGSNGMTQPGLYHEDELLPEFVYGFGEVQGLPAPLPLPPTVLPKPKPRLSVPRDSQNCKGNLPCATLASMNITQKMETPVIYFYSDTSRTVDVNVKFPQGVLTDTFPAPVKTSPKDARGPMVGGDTTFRVDVIGNDSHLGDYILPKVEPGNIYGHARKVSANLVQTNKDFEKFIFYRGIGKFQPDLMISSQGGGLSIRDPQPRSGDEVFVVHVDESGHGNLYAYKMPFTGLGHLNSELIEKISAHPSQEKTFSGAQASAVLIAALVKSGLYKDEAEAMVKTWEHGYLKVPGLRVLYILPPDEVKSFLPMQITPQPDELVRVFVGRIEVMLDTAELKILGRIKIEREKFNPLTLGRFAEPMLRRVREVYQQRCESTSTGVCDPVLSQLIDGFVDMASRGNLTHTVVQ